MKRILTGLIYVLKNEKKKIFAFMLFVLAFIVLLFPYGDLSDFVTAQISKATNNQVFVQFEDPGISLFPGLGFELNQVNVETNFLPPIKAGSITVAPSVMGLLTFSPGVRLSADKVFGGEIDLSVKQAKINGKTGQNVSIDTENLELTELLKLASSSFPIRGKLSLSANGDIENTFVDQPSAQIEAQINRFDLTSDTIATPLGPLSLPPVSLNKVNLRGELREGRFMIEQFTAGQAADELSANIKGRMDVRVQPGPMVTPGAYDLEIRISARESFKQKAGLFLSFLNSFQKPGGEGVTIYAFRIKGNNFYVPPSMTPL